MNADLFKPNPIKPNETRPNPKRKLIDLIEMSGEWRPLDLEGAQKIVRTETSRGASRATSAALGLYVCPLQVNGVLIDVVTIRDGRTPQQVLVARMYMCQRGGGAMQHWSIFPTTMNEQDVLASALKKNSLAFLQRTLDAQHQNNEAVETQNVVFSHVSDLTSAELMQLHAAIVAERAQRIAKLEAAIKTLTQGADHD